MAPCSLYGTSAEVLLLSPVLVCFCAILVCHMVLVAGVCASRSLPLCHADCRVLVLPDCRVLVLQLATMRRSATASKPGTTYLTTSAAASVPTRTML